MKNFCLVANLLLSAAGVVGVWILLIGLEWIKIIPVELEAADKTCFILIGSGIVLLVVSIMLLLRCKGVFQDITEAG